MNTKEISKLMEAYSAVVSPVVLDEKKKLDPVDDKANDKEFKDRKDKDIDNDGDVDSSDEFLHKKRAATDDAIDGGDKPAKNAKPKKGVNPFKKEDVDLEEGKDEEEEDDKKKKPNPFAKKDDKESEEEDDDSGEDGEDEDGEKTDVAKDGKKKTKMSGNVKGKTAEISKIGESLDSVIDDMFASMEKTLKEAVAKRVPGKDGEKHGETQSKGEKDFTDAHTIKKIPHEDLESVGDVKVPSASEPKGQGAKGADKGTSEDESIASVKKAEKVKVKEDTRSEMERIMDVLSGKSMREINQSIEDGEV